MPILTPKFTISVANLPDKVDDPGFRARAERFAGPGGVLSLDEAVDLYRASLGTDIMPSVQELAQFLGAEQHEIDQAVLTSQRVLELAGGPYAPNYKGEFRIEGFNDEPGYRPAGHVTSGRREQLIQVDGEVRSVDMTTVLLNFDLIRFQDFERLESATLVVGPRGFPREPGASQGESDTVQLTAYSQPGRPGFPTNDRFGRPVNVQPIPELKFLAAAMETEDLRRLSEQFGSQGIEFYAELKFQGRDEPVFINLDGKVGRNFGISHQELRAHNSL
jgi:hypothetical protein